MHLPSQVLVTQLSPLQQTKATVALLNYFYNGKTNLLNQMIKQKGYLQLKTSLQVVQKFGYSMEY